MYVFVVMSRAVRVSRVSSGLFMMQTSSWKENPEDVNLVSPRKSLLFFSWKVSLSYLKIRFKAYDIAIDNLDSIQVTKTQ